MSPHPRNARNRGLPSGLRERNGYWSWTDPDGREWGVGRLSRTEAIAEAAEALARFTGNARVRLADRMDGTAQRTLGAWMAEFQKRLDKRELAPASLKLYRTLTRRTLALLGEDSVLERLTTRDIAAAIQKVQEAGKATMARSLRGFLSDAFRSAVAAGWLAVNPVTVTDRVQVKVRRARLTLETFLAIRAVIKEVWAVNAMDLALLTAQRREDVLSMRFADVKGDVLTVEQKKTGARLAIPMSLRLDAVELSLADVIRRCRSTGVISQFVIHQVAYSNRLRRGSQVSADRVTKRFAETVRDHGLHIGPGSPPTFHEIRSLSKRLFRQQGNVDTKQLLGHKSDQKAALYDDARGAEWTRVTVL